MFEIFVAVRERQRGGSGVRRRVQEALGDLRPGEQRLAQERRKALRPPDRIESDRTLFVRHHRYGATARKRARTKLPARLGRFLCE